MLRATAYPLLSHISPRLSSCPQIIVQTLPQFDLTDVTISFYYHYFRSNASGYREIKIIIRNFIHLNQNSPTYQNI